MKRLLGLAVIAGVLVAPAAADASPIRECGQRTSNHWSYAPPNGAGIQDLTTRNINCLYARTFVDAAMYGTTGRQWRQRERGKTWRVYLARTTFTCRILSSGYEYSDIRCTRPGQVIRWQTGA